MGHGSATRLSGRYTFRELNLKALVHSALKVSTVKGRRDTSLLITVLLPEVREWGRVFHLSSLLPCALWKVPSLFPWWKWHVSETGSSFHPSQYKRVHFKVSCPNFCLFGSPIIHSWLGMCWSYHVAWALKISASRGTKDTS